MAVCGKQLFHVEQFELRSHEASEPRSTHTHNASSILGLIDLGLVDYGLMAFSASWLRGLVASQLLASRKPVTDSRISWKPERWVWVSKEKSEFFEKLLHLAGGGGVGECDLFPDHAAFAPGGAASQPQDPA